jgi:hypothetical protein
MMSASPGVIVSKTGKFKEDGGMLGVDFVGFTSLKLAQTGRSIQTGDQGLTRSL